MITSVDTDCHELSEVAARVISGARESIDVIVADADPTEAVCNARRALLSVDERIGVRLLCTRAMIDRGLTRVEGDDREGIEIRVARIPRMQALIVDGRVAVVCAGAADGRRASVIRAATVIRALHTYFEGLWQHATVVAGRSSLRGHPRPKAVRQILACLRSGVTDEVAARELSVSVRTYRRYVAEIMTMLGANSRFQAGVRAAELGLLPSGRQPRDRAPAPAVLQSAAVPPGLAAS
ncbi:transcriptional regulator [Streptomyces sp. SCUT-3]|uniref:response regulator transcription factor n=1 Tax=Streptomyces sp. SCUT-3 TaxID=2684469 RepID=UPI0015FBC8C7|nr:response regulator transcription factor [Streptomyces sp. SCUT-3]QMV22167.1 transcriptional regulator [Streptomyces sp. SCUT-3]